MLMIEIICGESVEKEIRRTLAPLGFDFIDLNQTKKTRNI